MQGVELIGFVIQISKVPTEEKVLVAGILFFLEKKRRPNIQKGNQDWLKYLALFQPDWPGNQFGSTTWLTS